MAATLQSLALRADQEDQDIKIAVSAHRLQAFNSKDDLLTEVVLPNFFTFNNNIFWWVANFWSFFIVNDAYLIY